MRNTFSVIIICLSLLILGSFLSLSNNLQFTAKELSKNLAVVFFLKKNLTEKERKNVEDSIRKSSSVTDVRYIGSEEALKRFNENFPELREIIKNLEVNPFPSSFEASISEKSLHSDEVLSFIEKMKNIPGIEDIYFNRDWIEKMQSLSRLTRAIGLLFGGVLILASFFIISNAIKLNVLARKEEIIILRMVGATNTFIRTPFLLEGAVLGILGGLLSLFFLFLLTKLFPIYLGSSLGVLNELIKFRYLTPTQSAYIIAGGALIGLLGSLSSMSRFLKI